MANRRPAIIVDIDGTLADISHRRHFVEGKGKDKHFGKFLAGIPNDKLNKWCEEIIVSLQNDYRILLVTGREFTPQVARDTIDWLFKNNITYDKLLARKEGDFRKDSEVKKEIYNNEIKDKYDVLFCIDDRQQVVDMWRSLGLVCLQCDKGDF